MNKNIINVSVRELAEYLFRSGDLNFEFAASNRSSALKGIRAHQKIQRSQKKNYQSEVSVSTEYQVDDLTLHIGGRIDGIYLKKDNIIIEEIKSTSHNPEEIALQNNPVHWAQAKLYAWIYARNNNLEQISIQLFYSHHTESSTHKIKKVYSFIELDAFVKTTLKQYLDWYKKIHDWIILRNNTSKKLSFPYEDFRKGQRALAVRVFNTLKNKKQLLAQAPTGIGKTMAVLFPAIKSISPEDKAEAKIFYLCARTTGKMIAEATLADMQKKGLRLKSITITAKEKACFEPDAACNGEECRFARSFFDKLKIAQYEIFNYDAFPRELITELSLKYEICPFEYSLELATWSDVIICDYNYAFNPWILLSRFFGKEKKEHVFLIDESHNLVDRSRDMYSIELDKISVMNLRKKIKNKYPGIYKTLTSVNNRLNFFKKTYLENEYFYAQKESPLKLKNLLIKTCFTIENVLMKNNDAFFRKELTDTYFTYMKFIRITEMLDENYSVCYSAIGKNIIIKLFCMDASAFLTESFKQSRAAVLFSATLTPPDYFCRVLGCNDDISLFRLPSPFPKKNACLLLANHISTYYNDRENTLPEMTQLILQIITAKKGNYLIFFPSYKYLELIAAAMPVNNDSNLLIQSPGMTEQERDEFIDNFKQDNKKTLIGLAVLGGVFGEGIDLKGEFLTGAVIISVGLPQINGEQELIKKHFNEKGKNGFSYAYTFPGMNRVLQAAGRVIRSETDKGVICLIDKRYSSALYRNLMPLDWQIQLCSDNGQINKLLKEFWQKT